MGQPPTALSVLFGLEEGGEIRPDEFYGMSGLEAAKRYLKKRGQARPFDEIGEERAEGGELAVAGGARLPGLQPRGEEGLDLRPPDRADRHRAEVAIEDADLVDHRSMVGGVEEVVLEELSGDMAEQRTAQGFHKGQRWARRSERTRETAKVQPEI